VLSGCVLLATPDLSAFLIWAPGRYRRGAGLAAYVRGGARYGLVAHPLPGYAGTVVPAWRGGRYVDADDSPLL
jgi:hypothetical protein